MKDMLPSLVPAGFRAGTQIALQVVPARHVLVLPRERIRVTDGKGEVLVGEPPEWRVPPEGTMIHEMEAPLPPELCDVVAMLASIVEDTMGLGVVIAPGQQPRGKASMALFAELGRASLLEWQARHLGALRGRVEP
jgi:hypothetical protein